MDKRFCFCFNETEEFLKEEIVKNVAGIWPFCGNFCFILQCSNSFSKGLDLFEFYHVPKEIHATQSTSRVVFMLNGPHLPPSYNASLSSKSNMPKRNCSFCLVDMVCDIMRPWYKYHCGCTSTGCICRGWVRWSRILFHEKFWQTECSGPLYSCLFIGCITRIPKIFHEISEAKLESFQVAGWNQRCHRHTDFVVILACFGHTHLCVTYEVDIAGPI